MSSEVFGDIYAQKMKNFDVEATLVNNQYIIGKYIKDCYEYFVPNQEKKNKNVLDMKTLENCYRN